MLDIDRLFTDEQLEKIKEITHGEPHRARERIITLVLTEMTPPDGIERELDSHDRVQMYDGYRAQTLAACLTQELS